MALTITEVETNIFGTTRVYIGTVAFDSSYPTGGETLTPTDLGLEDLFFVDAIGAGYQLVYDHANSKILAYYGDNNNASDGPLIQVPDTTDLSAVTARIFAIGR